MASRLPQLTGRQLIQLLEKGGFEIVRQARHGLAMRKRRPTEKTLVTVVKNTAEVIPVSTLMLILGPKQTQLGREGLAKLIRKDP